MVPFSPLNVILLVNYAQLYDGKTCYLLHVCKFASFPPTLRMVCVFFFTLVYCVRVHLFFVFMLHRLTMLNVSIVDHTHPLCMYVYVYVYVYVYIYLYVCIHIYLSSPHTHVDYGKRFNHEDWCGYNARYYDVSAHAVYLVRILCAWICVWVISPCA